jgi:hypothetical protein
LGTAGILKGRRFCSDVVGHPAFEGAEQVSEAAVQDGHIVTGQGRRIFYFTALWLEAIQGAEASARYRQWTGI